jgi:hypothetical protein
VKPAEHAETKGGALVEMGKVAVKLVRNEATTGKLWNRLQRLGIDGHILFDSVRRPKLWNRLQRLGIDGHILFACLQVKVNGKLSDRFVITVTGVKQGCPISPL